MLEFAFGGTGNSFILIPIKYYDGITKEHF